jgi:DnaJ-domain-containing protein 1
MSSQLVREPTPEEIELQQQQAKLLKLEAQLGQRELDLATVQAELRAFEHRYLQAVGIRHQELDRIEAQIAEYTAHLEMNTDFRPSDQLKQLYREVAKRIHPDLATAPEERVKRADLMAAANRAYAEGNIQRLQAILNNWELSPESVTGQGTAAELIRTLRKIAQSQKRLVIIERKLQALHRTELHQLQLRTQKAEAMGRDLLNEMARKVDQQIATAQKRLSDLKAKVG